MKTLGEKLKAIRISKGWTQEDLAHDLDISLTSYSKIERNKTDINFSRLEQISKIFKMSVMEILAWGDKSQSKLDEKYIKQLKQKDKEISQLQKKLIAALEKIKK